jgi:hypothetical protein
MAFILTSPAFANNGEIPAQYTCDGISSSERSARPPLAGLKSLLERLVRGVKPSLS